MNSNNLSRISEPYKTVYKPWGKEIWLELNDHYCYKRIYINKGYKTSYQYHEFKKETNFIIEGKAEVWLEDELTGEVKTYIMGAGDFFSINPMMKHRVIAITDIILQEVSTPQVDDVIRIDDDNDREDGRIDSEHKIPAVCILASGSGTRLKEFGANFNKGLLKINNKAAISHIIDKFPKEYDIYITLGYKSESLREYCLAAHPNRNIYFVSVDNVDGPGSGPGNSLLSCEKYLDRPFYITTVDCLVDGEIPPINTNWLGLCDTGIPEIFSTVDIDERGNIKQIINKSHKGFNKAFIGLAAVYQPEIFWNQLKTNIGDSGELICAWHNCDNYLHLTGKDIQWYDIGTVDNYMSAKEHFEKNSSKFSIDKNTDERFYMLNGQFIKINKNNKLIKNIISRSKSLSDIVPHINYEGDYCFSYTLVDGKTLYDTNDINVYRKFLDWCVDHLKWNNKHEKSISKECMEFYKNKTISRVNMLRQINDEYYSGIYKINGLECKSCEDYIENEIDWDYLCDGIVTDKFHGDLQFDNVIYNNSAPNGEIFKLIDWRDSFANSTTFGDIYYDISKLYGCLEISYKFMKDYKNNINISSNRSDVIFSYKEDETLKIFKDEYEHFISSLGLDIGKVKIITALIFLNMSPLHKYPMREMLLFKFLETIETIKL